MPWDNEPGMSEDELLGHLGSGEFDRVNRALVYLGSASAVEPTEKVARRLIELCSDGDPDVRYGAVYAAGFRWKIPGVLPLLEEILSRPLEDELVLNAAVYAVGELSRTNPAVHHRGQGTLARAALAETMPRMVRGNAYALALSNAGRISLDSFAKMGTPGSDVAIDRDWLLSLLASDV